MKRTSPIGVFDSGIGGLTIWKEIKVLMPNESTIYIADSDNAPYGTKTKDEILELCVFNTEFLLNKGCKIIVVACNTATTNAIEYLRQQYPQVSFIGIEPAIKPAALHTKTKSVGVLATKGTLASELFLNTSELYTQNIKVIEQIGAGLVDLIETGQIHSHNMYVLLQKYLKPMIDSNIDYLVLGCTHYPLLIPVLKTILPKSVSIIDSGNAVAKQTQHVLKDLNLLSSNTIDGKDVFFVNSKRRVIEDFVPLNSKIIYIK